MAWETMPPVEARMTFPIFVELAVRMISPGSNLSILIRFTIPPILDARQNSIMIFGDPHFQRGRALATHRVAISASGNNFYDRTEGNFPLARPQALAFGLSLVSTPSLRFRAALGDPLRSYVRAMWQGR